jgi:hypothetical protein
VIFQASFLIRKVQELMTATSVDLNKYELRSPANITTHPIHMDGYLWMVHNHPSKILIRTSET